MAEAFRAMLPTPTQGGGENLLEETEVAKVEEVENEAVSKVADGSVPVAPNA